MSEDLHFSTNGGAEPVLVPKHSVVQCNFFAMFRAPWVIEPDSFLPERWSQVTFLKAFYLVYLGFCCLSVLCVYAYHDRTVHIQTDSSIWFFKYL